MLVNLYRLEIQFKKVRKVRNINNILMVGYRPLECRPAKNVCAERALHDYITFNSIYCSLVDLLVILISMFAQVNI
jgi:hypothetical protein